MIRWSLGLLVLAVISWVAWRRICREPELGQLFTPTVAERRRARQNYEDGRCR